MLRVGIGMDGVVMVASVGRVDRDERQVAASPRGAPCRRGGGVRGIEHGGREDMRDAVLFKRDQADGLFARDVAEPLDDAAGGQAEATAFRHSTETSSPSRAPLAASGETTSSWSRRLTGTMRASPSRSAEDAEGRARRTLQELDHARRIARRSRGSGVSRARTRSPMPGARSALALSLRRDDDARRRAPFLVPFDGDADRLALVVDALDRKHGDGGEVAGPVQALFRLSISPSSARSFKQPFQADLLTA